MVSAHRAVADGGGREAWLLLAKAACADHDAAEWRAALKHLPNLDPRRWAKDCAAKPSPRTRPKRAAVPEPVPEAAPKAAPKPPDGSKPPNNAPIIE
jgi:hypothetical protein